MTDGRERSVRFIQTSEPQVAGNPAFAGSGKAGRYAATEGSCPARSDFCRPAQVSPTHSAGRLADLMPVQADAVRYMRLWRDGPASQCIVWNEFATRLGTACGRAALKSFEHLVGMCVRCDRFSDAPRPVECPSLSIDESLLAQIVGAALRGDREGVSDAARKMVGAGRSAALADRAASVAPALQDMRRHAGPCATGPCSLRPSIN